MRHNPTGDFPATNYIHNMKPAGPTGIYKERNIYREGEIQAFKKTEYVV